MSRKGNPWDNAACESFMKMLEYEEVLRNCGFDIIDEVLGCRRKQQPVDGLFHSTSGSIKSVPVIVCDGRGQANAGGSSLLGHVDLQLRGCNHAAGWHGGLHGDSVRDGHSSGTIGASRQSTQT